LGGCGNKGGGGGRSIDVTKDSFLSINIYFNCDRFKLFLEEWGKVIQGFEINVVLNVKTHTPPPRSGSSIEY
jgi:hypothetical protein